MYYGYTLYFMTLLLLCAHVYEYVRNRVNHKNLLQPGQVRLYVRAISSLMLLVGAYYADIFWFDGKTGIVRHIHLVFAISYLLIVWFDYLWMRRWEFRKTCPDCYGRGKVAIKKEDKSWWWISTRPKASWPTCENCNGKGWIPKS